MSFGFGAAHTEYWTTKATLLMPSNLVNLVPMSVTIKLFATNGWSILSILYSSKKTAVKCLSEQLSYCGILGELSLR